MSLKIQAKNIALDVLHRRSDEGIDPWDFADEAVEDEVLARLDEVLQADDGSRQDALRELVKVALREADRVITTTRGERMRVRLLDQLWDDYDPYEVLVLGGRKRIRKDRARFEHLDRNLSVETTNNIAQNEAFARKYRERHALREALRPLDPRATVSDVVNEVREDDS